MSNPLANIMPGILKHEGVWRGEYQVIDLYGKVIDRHASRVECEFPSEGEVVYRQHNQFTWEGGREVRVSFDGVLEGNRIFWDTPTFRGYGWSVNESVFILELDRKDVEDARFTEIIALGESGRQRARTWHWFKDGKCYQRTLCNETLR